MKKLLLLIESDSQIRDVCLRWAERHLGATVRQYGDTDPDTNIKRSVLCNEPDVCAFSGGGLSRQPSIDTLKWIKTKCRSVFIGWDAACPDWWPNLKAFREQKVFDLTTAVDGVPGTDVDYVSLSPMDVDRWDETITCVPRAGMPRFVSNLPNRDIELGFGGGISDDHPRARLYRQLADVVTVRDKGNPPGPDAEYVRFVKRCWATLNSSWIGDPRRQMVRHVKGRCIEAALGGSALFEAKGSPLAHWFEPGVDYFEFDEERPRDILDVIRRSDYHAECTLRAGRMRTKVLERYHPSKFWSKVLDQ